MPRGVNRSSQSSAARAMVHTMGSPTGLDSFLGGFTTGTEHSTEADGESEYVVNLKLLNKTSEITKQKAFDRLLDLMETTSEDVLMQFAKATSETVIQHAQHAKPAIRTASFQLLHAFMSRGKELKRTIAPELKVLAVIWVMGMNDMEKTVAHAASAAFDAAFAGDKKTLMLQQFLDPILEGLRTAVEEVRGAGKPLQDDSLDPSANKVYAALKSMGYMVKQVSASQPVVVKFVQDPQSFGSLVPTRPMAKGYLLTKTPLVRSSVLGLLRDVITTCPATAKIHQLVASALAGTILDTDVSVASRTWEVMLFWCRTNVADVVSNMRAGFLDDVVNCFMGCDKPELAEVIYPCIFPFLTSLSKDARCEGMLDEFCAALVEKLRLTTETPNVSARDLGVLLSAVLECWELHCVRKRNTEAADDAVELFTVICYNFVVLMQSDAKDARYHATAIPIVATSLLKTGGRCEEVFLRCLDVLSAQPSAAFRVLPETPGPGEQRSFDRFQGRLLGRLCAKTWAPAPSLNASSSGGANGSPKPTSEAISSTARCRAAVAAAGNGWLQRQIDLGVKAADPRWPELAVFFTETQQSDFCPSDAVVDQLLELLCAHLVSVQAEDDGEEAVNSGGSTSPRSAVVAIIATAALEWRHRPGAAALLEATSATRETTVREAALQHILQDPVKLEDVLTGALRTLNAENVHKCVTQCVAQDTNFTEAQQAGLVSALREGLQTALNTLTEEKEEEEQDSSDSDADGSSGGEDGSGSSSNSHSSSSSTDASGESGSDRASETSQEKENLAKEILPRAREMCEHLHADRPLALLLGLNPETFTDAFLTVLTHLTVALGPIVFPEQYTSLQGMRQLSHHQLTAAQNATEEEDFFTDAMEAKRYGVDTGRVTAFTQEVTALLDSYPVPTTSRDLVATALLDAAFSEERALPLSFFAVHQLAQLAPFASNVCLQAFVLDAATWRQAEVNVDVAGLCVNETVLSLYDGYLGMRQLRLTFGSVVHSGQLVRLMSTTGAAGAAATALEPAAAADLFCAVLRVAACKDAFNYHICRTLEEEVLPALFGCFDNAAVAVAVAERLTATIPGSSSSAGNAFPYLLPTLAAVLRDIATAEDTVFLRRAIRVVSAVSSRAVSALFTANGATGISSMLSLAYTTFFAILDEAADELRFNIAAQIPTVQERLLLEASCQLPTWDLTTAKLTLVVVRHLASMPAVADTTVRSLIDYAAKQNALAGLELLAELACTRIPSPEVYSELVRVIVDALCRVHRLRHLPPNGRLQCEAAGGSLLAATPTALTTLRRVVMAAVLARRGVVLHSRMDSVLRSTVNLVVFDAVCEGVSRLRSATEAEVVPLTKLIAFTSRFMSDLLTGDVMSLRASEVSAMKVAGVLHFAYAWLYATSISKLELLGLSTVASVLRSVCLLANLTLTRSTVLLHDAVRPILQRPSLKPLRMEFSTAAPAKVAQFRLLNAALRKTHKQKMLLFPYLLSWCVYLTAPALAAEVAQSNEGTVKEWQRQVYSLLDLLYTLMLTPIHKNLRRIDQTFLGASAHPSASAEASVTGQLGFEVVALTRVDSTDVMAQLARGAFSVFTQLLHGSTLALTKGWLETIERKGRALVYDAVGQHISTVMIQESFMSVLAHSPDGGSTFSVVDGGTVEVNVAQQVINLSYEMEDAKVGVRISFPAGYPLRPPTAEYDSGRKCGVSVKKWRAWMRKMSAILFSGSANIWDCIELFHQNLEAHFSGIEPCPICFAVVSAVNHKLPDVRCSVCHNSAFHSNCLYTWWASGYNNVCPLCRSPWMTE